MASYGEFFKKYSTPEWRARVDSWLQKHLAQIFKGQDPRSIAKFKSDYASLKVKYPDIALRMFWKDFAPKLKKNPELDPEEILDPSTPITDDDILPDENALKPRTLQESLQLWQAARTTADQIRAIDGVGLPTLKNAPGLPADFINDLIEYGSPEVAKAARKLRSQAPSGEDLTMRPRQALQFLRTQGVSIDHLSLTTATMLDVIMPDTSMMWELDFSAKKAQLGSVDRAGNFKPMKSFQLSDGFIHKLADFWKDYQ